MEIPYLDFIADESQYSYKGIDLNNVCTIFSHLQCYAYVKGCGNNINKEDYGFLFKIIDHLCKKEKFCHEMQEFNEAPKNIFPKYDIQSLKYVFNNDDIIKYGLDSYFMDDDMIHVGYKEQFKILITKLWSDALNFKIHNHIAIAFLSRQIAMSILFDIKNQCIFIRDSHIKYQYKFSNINDLFTHMENPHRIDRLTAYIYGEDTIEEIKAGSNSQIHIMIYKSNPPIDVQKEVNDLFICGFIKDRFKNALPNFDQIFNKYKITDRTKKLELKKNAFAHRDNICNSIRNDVIEKYWDNENKICFPKFAEYPIIFMNEMLDEVKKIIEKSISIYTDLRLNEKLIDESKIELANSIQKNYYYVTPENINLIIQHAEIAYNDLLYKQSGGNHDLYYKHKYLKYKNKYLLAKNNTK